jgi:hypothetical protein
VRDRLLPDTAIEPNETFNVDLSNQSANALFSDNLGLGTINNDDTATVSIAATTQAAEPATDGLFTVTQSAVAAANTDLIYSIGGSATGGADYTALTGTVTIPAGSTTATIDVTVLVDFIVEGTEDVILQLTGITASPGGSIDTGNDTATVNINDDDQVDISIDNVTMAEGDSGTTTFSFTVSIDQADPSSPVTVDWASSDGSATTAAFGTLTFPAGTAILSQSVAIDVTGDTAIEPNETFNVDSL